MTHPFVQTFIDLHPGVHYFVGQSQSGKSTAMQFVLSQWPGHSFAIDSESTDPPSDKHIARYATWWAERLPGKMPPGASLLACDECVKYTKTMDENAEDGTPEAMIYNLVRRSQHQKPHGITSLLGSQRPMDIGQDAWGQAKTVVMFRVIGDPDLQRLASLPGMPRELIRWLPSLEPGWAAVWHKSGRIEAPRCILEAPP